MKGSIFKWMIAVIFTAGTLSIYIGTSMIGKVQASYGESKLISYATLVPTPAANSKSAPIQKVAKQKPAPEKNHQAANNSKSLMPTFNNGVL